VVEEWMSKYLKAMMNYHFRKTILSGVQITENGLGFVKTSEEPK